MAGSRHRPIAHFAATVHIARTAAPGYWRQYRRDRQRLILPAPFRPEPHLWPDTGLHAAWLGHSTVLVKMDGFTFITDPVLGARCGVNMGPLTVGLRRLVEPALLLSQIPPVQLVLLSHAHFDHFDRATLHGFERTGAAVITAAQTSNLLRIDRFKSVTELSWGESAKVGPIKVSAFEVNHWGARIRTDTYRGYNGYLIESGRHRVLFGGDTAYTESFRGLRTSKPFDLAIMPVGAYDPWIHVHCNPEQALRMANDSWTEHILPVHHQTFQLSREPVLEPVERLLAAVGPDQHRVVLKDIGQQWSLK